MQRFGSLIVVSGPSGVGKSTLIKRVREELPDLRFSVSCTTREPRAGEEHGRDYYFLEEAEFVRKLERGEFLEHAQVFRHRYGTLRSEVVDRVRRGEQVILDIDVQGARQIREAAAHDPLIAAAVQFVIIAPPDPATLEARLRGRNSETAEQLQLRLDGALRELGFFRLYDYLVVNGDLDAAATELTAVFRAARLRTANITGELFA
ncbi:MAG: guanylate kinase [Lentisphaeria bacterium]|nr:guanylate kinase [Lentisphaeria bacterium]